MDGKAFAAEMHPAPAAIPAPKHTPASPARGDVYNEERELRSLPYPERWEFWSK